MSLPIVDCEFIRYNSQYYLRINNIGNFQSKDSLHVRVKRESVRIYKLNDVGNSEKDYFYFLADFIDKYKGEVFWIYCESNGKFFYIDKFDYFDIVGKNGFFMSKSVFIRYVNEFEQHCREKVGIK